MLKPALLFKEEILRKFAEYLYTDDYYYYVGYDCGSVLPTIDEHEDRYQYAFVDSNDNVIGFLSYRVNVISDTVQDFGLFSFDRGNKIIGKDLYAKLSELVDTHHKVEWSVIDGNPVKRHYDKFCKKYNGNIIHFHDCTKDRSGNYVDSYLYEIIKGKNISNN